MIHCCFLMARKRPELAIGGFILLGDLLSHYRYFFTVNINYKFLCNAFFNPKDWIVKDSTQISLYIFHHPPDHSLDYFLVVFWVDAILCL